MGRGSYLGGSTVIRPGMGWFSGETSQTRATSVRPKKKARQKSKPAATAPQLKNRPAKKYDFSGYLMSVVSAELRAQVIPLPKKPEPRATVLAYGDALTWARLMPEYEALKQKLAAKLSDQKKNSIGGHPPRSALREARVYAAERGIRNWHSQDGSSSRVAAVEGSGEC